MGALGSIGSTPITLPFVSVTGVPATRTISTTAPLTGGGDLSANRTLAISAATGATPGSMSAADKTFIDAINGGAGADVVLSEIAAVAGGTALEDGPSVGGVSNGWLFQDADTTYGKIGKGQGGLPGFFSVVGLAGTSLESSAGAALISGNTNVSLISSGSMNVTALTGCVFSTSTPFIEVPTQISQAVSGTSVLGGSTTPNPAANAHYYYGPLTSALTVANVVTPRDGARLVFEIEEDGTGGRTISFGTAYDLTGFVPSTAASAINVLEFEYSATKSKWFLMAGSVSGAASSPGRVLSKTVVTNSSNFTTGANTRQLRLRGVGGGGAGGGCTSVAAAAAGAGGGGAGTPVERTIAVSPNTAYAYTSGAGGTGVSGAAGGNGVASTFVIGATTITAPGGTGGAQAVASTTLTANPGGAGGAAATNADVATAGAPGHAGFSLIVATDIVIGGAGGSGPYGGGGAEVGTSANGNAATGFGAGGGGSATGASTARTGGNGTAGMWIIEELS